MEDERGSKKSVGSVAYMRIREDTQFYLFRSGIEDHAFYTIG
jgi:hypothetical protein